MHRPTSDSSAKSASRFDSGFDEAETAGLFGASLNSKRGIFGKEGLLSPAIPDYEAPQWGGERGFRGLELKLLIGVAAVGGGLLYGVLSAFAG